MKQCNWFVRIATLGPVGYCRAPGTLASLVTLPLVWCVGLLQLNFFVHVTLLCVVCAGALFIIGRALRTFTEHDSDPSEIVLDELVGCLVTFCGISMNVPALAVGFLLFRFFDIFKPLGIHQIEKLAGEWGVVFDDVAAGAMSCALLYLLGL